MGAERPNLDPGEAMKRRWLVEAGAWRCVRWKEGKCAQDAVMSVTEVQRRPYVARPLLADGWCAVPND